MHRARLRSHTADQFGAISSCDVEAIFTTEERTNPTVLDLARVSLRVDCEDARGTDHEMVDIGP